MMTLKEAQTLAEQIAATPGFRMEWIAERMERGKVIGHEPVVTVMNTRGQGERTFRITSADHWERVKRDPVRQAALPFPPGEDES
jgi:hypothetical protein